MLPQLQLIPGAISEILASSSSTGILTRADRYGLLAAILDDQLNEEERSTINRLLFAVRKGRIKVIDDFPKGEPTGNHSSDSFSSSQKMNK